MLERGTPCPRYAFMFLVIRISSRVVHPLLLVAKVFPCSPIAPIHYRQPDSSPSVEGRPGNCMQILLTTTRSTKLPNNDPTRFLITIFLLTYTIPLRSCLSRSLRKEREKKKKKSGKILIYINYPRAGNSRLGRPVPSWTFTRCRFAKRLKLTTLSILLKWCNWIPLTPARPAGFKIVI